MWKRVPAHVGIIPDGNRRWAQNRGMEKREGYRHGIAPGLGLYRQLVAQGIGEATVYGFTRDNNKRAQDQRDAFTLACVEVAQALQSTDVDLLVVGNTQSAAFPGELLPYANRRVRCGKGGMKMNLLVNYDWEWDLKTALQTGGEIASAQISRMDMIVRWGGRRRLSGFLPVQSVYADFYVVDDYWPDYRDEHFLQALEWYQSCDVTLGG